MYEFQKPVTFSTDGGLDELIALDRYVVSTTDPQQMRIGDTVVFITDRQKGSRKVGTIEDVRQYDTNADSIYLRIRDRNGGYHPEVPAELVTKVLETQPEQMWRRWAHGAALVEADCCLVKTDRQDTLEEYENEFRRLFDGFGYSPGGRIQLGLGHEYLGMERAPLTLTNCFVIPSPKGASSPYVQWMNVIDTVATEMEISRRGGGVGINISHINTVKGAGSVNVGLHLPADHKDSQELEQMKRQGKFDSVTVSTGVVVMSRYERSIYVEDSIEGHVKALRDMVKAAYSGVSIILDFSQIRHRNAVVKGVNGRSSGAAAWMELFALVAKMMNQADIDAVEFAEVFSFVINLIQQGGSRRGALMLVCNDDAPVVEKFITRKRTPGCLTGANISVGISDYFMGLVKDAMEGRPGDTNDMADALRLWNLIIESAHASAEPGVIWLERYNKLSNTYYYNTIEATNPCGEQGLPPNGACNLGHLVLPAYLVGDWTKGEAWLDSGRLGEAVETAVRFQDNMVDYGFFPTEETKQQQEQERRVGIGTMGLGTMLIMLGIKYGSEECDKFLDGMYSHIAYHAYKASINLAAEKGSFPAFDPDKFLQSKFVMQLVERFPDLAEGIMQYGIRNATLLTQAPTGSTGTYIDNIPELKCSTGIEPYYSLEVYYRAGQLGESIAQYPKIVQEWMDANPGKELPEYFVSAMQLPPEAHVLVQAAIQKWVDSSISKTVNAPEDLSVEDTDKLYMLAYDKGCKGMTIYRDGCREAQVLSTTKEGAKLEKHLEASGSATGRYKSVEGANVANLPAERKADEALTLTYSVSLTPEVPAVHKCECEKPFKKRPGRLPGFTEKVKAVMGDRVAKVYVTVNVDPATALPCEVFVSSNDVEAQATAAALGRMTTQFLRFAKTQDNIEQACKHLRQGQSYGTLPWHIANLLDGVACGKIDIPGIKKAAPVNALKVCSACGEKAYDKPNCVCLSCGASHCN